jgi:hypothetical protein
MPEKSDRFLLFRDLGIEMNRGLMTAFMQLNDTDALRGLKFNLITEDDYYEPVPARANTYANFPHNIIWSVADLHCGKRSGPCFHKRLLRSSRLLEGFSN